MADSERSRGLVVLCRREILRCLQETLQPLRALPVAPFVSFYPSDLSIRSKLCPPVHPAATANLDCVAEAEQETIERGASWK